MLILKVYFGVYTVALVIGVLGFIGNTLAFIGFNKEHQPTSTIFLFKALAIIDNIVLVLVCPSMWVLALSFLQDVGSILESKLLLVFHYLSPILETVIMTSAYTTVVLAMDRVVLVCLPTRQWSTKTAKVVLAVLLVCAVAYNIAYYFLFTTYEIDNHTIIIEKYEEKSRYFHYIGRPVVFCIIPVTILITSTIILLIKLRQIRRGRDTQTRLEDRNQNVTWMLVTILIVFIVCSLPWPLLSLIRLSAGLSVSDIEVYLSISIHFCHIVNSSVNFLIYAGFSRFYRNRMLSSLTCFRQKCMTGNADESGSEQSKTGRWNESAPDVERVTTI